MKRKLFFAAMTVAALAGCVKVEMNGSDDKSERNLITFASPVTGRSLETKANVHGELETYTYAGSSSTYTYPRTEDFVIFAVQHKDNLVSWDDTNNTNPGFNGCVLKYDSDVDSWAPKKDDGSYYYWPTNTKMSFAAMSPANLEQGSGFTNPTYGKEGLTITDFTIPANPADQFDLMFSKRAADLEPEDMLHTADHYSGVPLVFQHALSSIHFSLLKDNNVTAAITLTSIILTNAKNKGTFKENITEGTDASQYKVGADGNVQPSWTPYRNDVGFSKAPEYQAFSGEVEFPISPKYVSVLAAEDGTADNDNSSPLLLMPQQLEDDVILQIKYKVDGTQLEKNVKLNEYGPVDGSVVTKWDIGYKYTYRLHYSQATEKKDIICFSPSAESWKDGGVIVIEL